MIMEETSFDPKDMIDRFARRARAVKERTMPPVEGIERQQIRKQMQLDYQDFAMLADAEAKLEYGILTITIDLRPQPE